MFDRNNSDVDGRKLQRKDVDDVLDNVDSLIEDIPKGLLYEGSMICQKDGM